MESRGQLCFLVLRNQWVLGFKTVTSFVEAHGRQLRGSRSTELSVSILSLTCVPPARQLSYRKDLAGRKGETLGSEVCSTVLAFW